MIRAGIYGATGYTGIELARLLDQHPRVTTVFATARSAAGQRLSDVFPTTLDLPLIAAEEADLSQVDVVFCCLPHGTTVPTVQQALAAGVRVVDLSADFRLRRAEEYERWYGSTHSAPHLLETAVYGLPEVYREDIAQAQLVANPGCYPTSVILPLLPLVRANLLADATVIADSKSGISGAGRSLSLKTHFSETHENFSAYNIGRSHRHIAEMDQETGLSVIFSPHLLPVVRGILSTLYITLLPDTPAARVHEVYATMFADEPFVTVLPDGRLPELRHVVGNNQCVIGIKPVALAPERCIVVSVIDNLLKGASGQAVQNMNIMFGLEETLGLL
ncbi:MAG: N-acetyl-gamma-glutamyl-phosphate reductase [Chloroflexaceae bacterium]|nr:N-acetyl-gamma-glutamyl-phosphate reductase [Chloroflexaceae bacterium]